MARVAWINPTSGMSGDMCLSAMVDLGADQSKLVERLGTIHALAGFSLVFHHVDRAGVRALQLEASLPESPSRRKLSDILAIIEDSGLTSSEKALSTKIFFALASAEAKVHGVPVEQVELHEVGALDSILDICGFAVAKELLNLDQLIVSPPALGSGVVSTEHGKLAVPAPAVLELLLGKVAYGGSPGFEATTPTGAAIISEAALLAKAMPRMTVEAVGYGAGAMNPAEFANVVQIVAGTLSDHEMKPPEAAGHFEQVVELQTNLDDITGELGGHLISTLISKGALDAFITPAIAKKDRPAMVLTVLARPGQVAGLSTEIFRATGTLGIRTFAKDRYVLDREFVEVTVLGERISVKVGPYRSKPEFDQLVALSEQHGVSVLLLEQMVQAELEKRLEGS